VPHTHSRPLPKQTLGVRRWKQATDAEQRLDTRRQRLTQSDALGAGRDFGAQASLACGYHTANLVQSVTIVVVNWGEHVPLLHRNVMETTIGLIFPLFLCLSLGT